MSRAFVLALLALVACSRDRGEAPANVDIQLGGASLRAEIAANESTRNRGLMLRRDLPENAGMLFVYADDVTPTFWMKDTFIALSLAYLDAGQRIIALDDLEPFSLAYHRPPRPIRFVLEVNHGWFARHDIRAGELASFHLGELDVE